MNVTRFDGRRFQMWRYVVSHSWLLLMSPKDEIRETRVCILFVGVRHIDLPHLLAIDEIRDHTLAEGEHFYELVARDGAYRINALGMTVETDAFDWNAPTIFERTMGPV